MSVRGQVGGTVAVAALLWLVYGLGFVGYDSAYGLIWGRDIVHGHLPDYRPLGTPTPHPLQIAAAALLSPLRSDALPAMAVLSLFVGGALGVGAFALGRALFGAPAGVFLAVALLTRDFVVNGIYQSLVDVPYLALVVWALALEAARPRRGAPVLGLLALAGLVRPDAWLLSGAYLAWVLPARPAAERARLVALAAAAPALWLASDLVITSDPLFSLHHTQEGAERNVRPRGLDVAFQAAPRYLRDILHDPILLGGLAGLVLATWQAAERAALPGAVFVLGIVGFLALGVAQVSLLPRYYFAAAAMLALFCGVALAGWRELPRGSPLRLAWMALAAVLGVALLASVPRERERLAALRGPSLQRAGLERDLRRFVDRPAVRAWLAACPPLQVRDARVVPLLAYLTRRRAGSEVFVPRPPRLGLFVGPPPQDDREYLLDRRLVSRYAVPLSYEPVVEGRRWALYRGC